ncbi:helix-turn-helix transcriptional regulator [Streptomyces rimosus]|uniref:helix-turn-helix transcriptional regulator n=1 Tax=Streptomyces rimosus TaxID=1927 RepID=UPI0018FF0AA3|nr:helix-turn-helix transcriptional regulator [Streptomyces rimosus]
MAHRDEIPDTGVSAQSPVPVPGPGASFADRLNYLFDRVRSPGADEFSNAHVARTIAAYGEENRCTGAYLSKLRKGESQPTVGIVKVIARFFGVKASYFLDDEEREKVTAQFELLRKLSDAGVTGVALRAIGLSPKSLGEVVKKIDAVRKQEGLPPAPEEPLP